MANYIEGTTVLTNEQPFVCGWHEREKDPEGSHGICKDCSNKVLYNFYNKKFDNVPPSVERFRDEHEEF